MKDVRRKVMVLKRMDDSEGTDRLGKRWKSFAATWAKWRERVERNPYFLDWTPEERDELVS
jgi:hypothetical protein